MQEREKWYVGLPNEAKYRAEEKAEALVREKDKKAKADGILIGRLLEVGVADGHASYVVMEEKGRQVRLKHMKWGDAYSDWHLGHGGWFPKSEIVGVIKGNDSWEDALDRNALASKEA